MDHPYWLQHCIELAERGRGSVSPNPLVGACLVKNGKLIAEGWHEHFGGWHAEASAIRKAGRLAGGATLYVSLEPCSTFGKTPPCTDAIVKAGIREVIVGALDPNPLHHKKGIAGLRKKGIPVSSGVLAARVARQNEAFFTFHQKKRPFVIVKIAESLDGKITTVKRSREWISSLPARKWSHSLRRQVDAVIAGTGTIEADDPRLTPYLVPVEKKRKSDCTFPPEADPSFGGSDCHFSFSLRVILDRELKLAKTRNVFNKEAKTLVFTSVKRSPSGIKNYSRGRNVEVLAVGESQDGLNIGEILTALHRMGISSVLVEGGGELIASFLNAGVVDKMFVFIAPLILGGRTAVTSVEGKGIDTVKKAIQLENMRYSQIGKDLLVEGYVHGNY
ncbi:MAG: bifunctional diaminohydroxyphosphoribosylaminopyrimidine deaminase/5-amino-6-(5-phosphoribosylamino)uracil reductase RibD [Candidatus Omnitrophica bacterium]|nr:bifunctional diaminohydroxyphosphoribosylaminopyrimidine deaminase/5-amino-6-(5-phosphoribosylamino)uracil reductase RibD [Candidatus Omnitrophota bacterium]